MELYKNLPIILFKTPDDWLDWLSKNHNQYQAIWVKLAKKNSDIPSITYEEAREGALIYGWIDGLTNKFDDSFYVIRFTPRRPKGNWSKINKTIVEELIRLKKMKPSGLIEVENAKADGRWNKNN